MCGGAKVVFLHCRKAKLENAVKVKERMLQTQRNKPDPLQGAAGLQRDITRLNGQIETAVSSPCPLASYQRPKNVVIRRCCAHPWYCGCNAAAGQDIHKG